MEQQANEQGGMGDLAEEVEQGARKLAAAKESKWRETHPDSSTWSDPPLTDEEDWGNAYAGVAARFTDPLAAFNAELSACTAAQDAGWSDERLPMAAMGRLTAARRIVAGLLAMEEGPLVLEAPIRPGMRRMGVVIVPTTAKPWRSAWFDDTGFSGHTDRADKTAAVLLALEEGYRDTNRGMLADLAATEDFRAGNASLPVELRDYLESMMEYLTAAGVGGTGAETTKPHR